MITILLIDDHALVRRGIRQLLEMEDDLAVVGEAANGIDGFRAFVDIRPEIVLLDLNMPGEHGLATLRRIRNRNPAAKVLILSMYNEPAFVTRALDYGAQGYLSKDIANHELASAVRAVAAGTPYIEPSIRERLHEQTMANQHPAERLTAREFEVFCLLANGHTVNEIAELLHLSSKTAGAHQTSIMKKLALKNSAQLVRTAILWGTTTI